MRRSRGALAAAVGVLGLFVAALAVAQEGDPAGAAEAAAAAEPDDKQVFDNMVDQRTDANRQGVAVQKQIDQLSDQTSDLVEQYRTTLKQIDSIRIYNGQMRNLIAAQEAELQSLRDQLDRVEEVGRSVTPLMLRMIAALEKFVELDVPFLAEERAERIAELRKLMARADVTTAEKFRNIMEAFQIENEYGRTIEAYRASLEQGGKETTVDFLRFGRVALVYQSIDEQQRGVWNQETRSWEDLDASYRSPIRQGLRIARKQAAPDLIQLPVPAATNAGGSI